MGDEKRKYPEGPIREMTPEWKALVAAKIARSGMSRRALAKAAGVSNGAITQMLDPVQVTSKAVDGVCRALGIHPPTVPWEVVQRMLLDQSLDARHELERLLDAEIAAILASTAPATPTPAPAPKKGRR